MPSEGIHGEAIRILVIDPSVGSGTDLASQLTFEGRDDFIIQTTPALEDARTVLSDERVDCVVTRHSPPTVDGVETLSALRSDHPEIPVLLATGRAHADHVLDSSATGIVEMTNGEVHEGFVANQIESVVSQVRERRNYESRLQASQESLQRLHRITSDPDSTFTDRVHQLLAFGADVFGMDIAFLARTDEDSADFEVVAAQGDHELIQAGITSDLSQTYCRRTIDADTDSPLALQNAPEEMRDDPAFETFDLGCYMGARIDVNGELYGTLCFADRDPRQSGFSDEEQALIEIMAQWLRQQLEQREYRRELAATRDRLKRTLERVDDAFFTLDTDWRVTYVNDVGADVLRRAMGLGDDAGVVGRHLWENVPEAVETAFFEKYHEAFQTQMSVSFEEYFEPLDVWFEVRAYPDEEGLSVYFTDITKRKAHERELERFRNLLNQTERVAEVGGWEIDVATDEVFWTDHLFDLLGVEYETEPPLDEALDVYHEADRPTVEHAVEEAIESEEAFDVELRYWKSEGELRWLRVQGVPITDSGGDVVRIRGAARDITEPKEREQTLNALVSASRAFIEAANEDELLTAIIDELERVFEYDITSVRLHDAETGTLPPTRYSPQAHAQVPDPPTFDDDEGPIGGAFQSQEPVVIDDLADATDIGYGRVESAMFIPLDDHGMLGVGATAPNAFGDEDAALVELLAVTAASAFDRLDRETEMRQLHRILDHLDEKVFLLDDDGAFTFVTRSLATYLGREPDQITGTPLTGLVSGSEGSSFETALREARAASPESRRTVETEVRLADGELRPVQFEFSSTTTERGDAAIAAVLHDISELAETRTSLEAERERFRELFENLPDPVVEVRFDGEVPVVEYGNPAFADTFGYGKERARGANLNALVVPDERSPDAGILYESTQTDEQVRVDVQRKTADGRRDFLVRSIPYSLDDDQFAFAVYTDITDQKERERYLQVLNRVLRHNLRNDMNVVMGLAAHLADQIDDPALIEHAERLRANAEDVAMLGEKAQELERVLGGRERDTRVIDLVPRLRKAVAEQRTEHPDADIELDVPGELWANGSEDITRALEELIENAIEHADAEVPAVTIRAQSVPNESDWTEIRVRDNGPGIPDSEWAVVSGETDISQLNHGSGLGLWLARWIVESSGGEIRRDQTPTAGTTVVLRLPGKPPAPSGEEASGLTPDERQSGQSVD
ncbi:multi-sensor signal transduction histidine kinase [Halorubrum saccharovorum DSM 1137]|mgnify:FL=1|uniref:histidine kinase n=1 Tax=Halorubrum saccharovorum DSM 1137 TaxID=1227484 RepID=M0E5T3_9EURY|nr:PAS domain S-box protein [Halorubrum saccharovorum]ELZ42277.1 multi-sensor signal transduction histidine kinase [Halorubrum saccharovorum DSM 1137]